MPLLQGQDEVLASPDITTFLLAQGRLPHLGDDVPPWRYRGWLLCIMQLADRHPKASGRWVHYERILQAGRLIDEPIPPIHFTAGPHTSGMKMLEACLRLIDQRESTWTSFQKFLEWLAWGLAVSKEMPQFREETNEALYRTFSLEPLILEPHDYLGTMLADRRGGGWNPHAFFPTPHTVCEFMTQIAMLV